MLFWTWLNTYFVSSSSSAPPIGGPASDQWRPVPGRTGARHDGSAVGRQCFVSMTGVGDGSDMSGLGGRCVTVLLPQPELDRFVQSSLDDVLRQDFTVRQ